MKNSTEEITIKKEPIIWDDVAVKQEDELSVNLNGIKSEELDEESLSINPMKQSNDIEQLNSITKLPIDLLRNMENSTDEITIKEEPIIWDDAMVKQEVDLSANLKDLKSEKRFDVAVKQEDDLSANLNDLKSEERFAEKSLSIDPLKQSNSTKQVWKKHQWVDNVKGYPCSLCEYKADRRKSLIRHIQTHFTKRTWYCCKTCGYKASDKYSLMVHKKTHRTIQECRGFECNLCNFSTFNKELLGRHRMTKHFKASKWVCHICGARLTQQRYLKAHLVKHESPKELRCNLCDFVSFEEDKLSEHVRQHVKDDSMVQCKICSGVFKKDCIKKHLKWHTDENKKHPCQLCEYKCIRKCNLETHMKMHDLENHLTCETCGYKTSKGTYLKNHMKLHIRNNN